MIATMKSRLRKEIKEKLNKQNDTQRLRKSRLIKEKLFEFAEFKRAKCVMFYIATDKEVETDFMIAEAQRIGKKIVVPTILKGEENLPEGRQQRIIASLLEDSEKELTPGPYGILQPQSKYIREMPGEKIDLVVVPGLAFDKSGRRLGRGGGYYDKFLASLPLETPRVGLAFDFQLIEDIPSLSHDIPVTRVISA